MYYYLVFRDLARFYFTWYLGIFFESSCIIKGTCISLKIRIVSKIVYTCNMISEPFYSRKFD